jgi:hypothetical protein
MEIRAVVKTKDMHRDFWLRDSEPFYLYYTCKLCRFKNGRMWWKTLNYYRPQKQPPCDINIFLVEGIDTNAFSTFFSFKEEHLTNIDSVT